MTTNEPEQSDGGFQLSAIDARAVDGFLDAREHDGQVANDSQSQAVQRLLSLLDTPVAAERDRGSRIDLTTLSTRRTQSNPLSELDQAALDQWIDSGCDLESLDSTLQPQGQTLEGLRELAVSGTLSDPSAKADLINRTLARIQSHIDAQQSVYAIPTRGRGTMRFRVADLISVAAVLLIVASVAMPIFSRVQSTSQQIACLGNLGTVADAFGVYANSNRDTLPMATAGFGPTWMNVGSTPDQSNSANLYTLIRTDHATLGDLACPSNPNAQTEKLDPGAWDWKSVEELSYSYRIMPKGGLKMHASIPVRVVLMSDRSPVTLRAIRGLPIIPEENSPNHNQSGQHILKLDGSTQWLTRPVLTGNDNLWLPRPIEQVIHQIRNHLGVIEGNEQPDGPTDAFVGP
ncbi:MAG: hypothetical protein JKY96_00030 [Phycisphaerales bacterium]|nr:hypothetical protein [Phycisphaerales bacterium]